MKKTAISICAAVLAAVLCASLGAGALAEGTAPVAENLELKTYQNTSVGGCLSAYDADGGALEYSITTQPVKGTIELGEDGCFVYTPREGKRGRDYFGYRATDEQGEVSQEATVIIKIEKAKREVMYSDMRGRADEYAAVALAQRGIFTGEQFCGEYCFNPEKTVTRGEFLTLCMAVSGAEPVGAVLSTGFADDAAMPVWMKGYVAAAAMRGVVDGGAFAAAFEPEKPITEAEAALMLDKAMGVTRVSYVALDETLSPAAAQACANLTACGIIDGEVNPGYLTRSAAAKMLINALEVLESRK